jgi:hypothetical protein
MRCYVGPAVLIAKVFGVSIVCSLPKKAEGNTAAVADTVLLQMLLLLVAVGLGLLDFDTASDGQSGR